MSLPPASALRLLVFDLDGTLVDSFQDLSNSINATLEHLGKPHLPQELIASYIGDGPAMLVRRALGDPEGGVHDEEYLQTALKYFMDYYRIHKLDNTSTYPGVLETLTAIQTTHPHLKMACLTNKPVNPSRDICRALGLEPYFFQNYGGNSFHTKKPDPIGLQTLMQEGEATPEQTVMIGDTAVDVLTARNAGTWSMGCIFGFTPEALIAAKPDALVHSPTEWASLLQ